MGTPPCGLWEPAQSYRRVTNPDNLDEGTARNPSERAVGETARVTDRAQRRDLPHLRGPGDRRLADLDHLLYRRLTDRPAELVDRIVYPLTRSADGGLLWLAVAAGLAASGTPDARRAAWRGTASLAVTSIVANVVVKPIVRRPRPEPTLHAWQSRPFQRPRTTSFPSGHAACAAAFAVGASLESPQALPLLPLAAAVGYSRVRTRVHYPLDVLAGWLIGTVVAVSSRRWPVRGPASKPCRYETPNDGGDQAGTVSRRAAPSQGTSASS